MHSMVVQLCRSVVGEGISKSVFKFICLRHRLHVKTNTVSDFLKVETLVGRPGLDPGALRVLSQRPGTSISVQICWTDQLQWHPHPQAPLTLVLVARQLARSRHVSESRHYSISRSSW